MFERFTPLARRTVVLSQEQARELGHKYIGTEHLLLALLALGHGGASKVLAAFAVDPKGIELRVREIIGSSDQRPEGDLPFTSRGKRALELSLRESLKLGHGHIGSEHLLLGLLSESEGVAAQTLVREGFTVEATRSTVRMLAGGNDDLPPDGRKSNTRNDSMIRNASTEAESIAPSERVGRIIGREAEINRIIQVLARQKKNNPVLYGESGVGKTTVLSGVREAIADRRTPHSLRDKQVVDIEWDTVLAASRDSGQFGDRIREALTSAAERGDTIVCIEDAHRYFDFGPRDEPGGVTSLLWSLVAGGRIQVLLTMSRTAYQRSRLQGSSLDRYCSAIAIPELSVDGCVEILKTLRPGYESHHQVSISDLALHQAVVLTHRHIGDRFLPGKALDLLDDCCALIGLQQRDDLDGARAEALRSTRDEIESMIAAIQRRKEAAIDRGDFEAAANAREDEKQWLEFRDRWDPDASAIRAAIQSMITVFRRRKEAAIGRHDSKTAAEAREQEQQWTARFDRLYPVASDDKVSVVDEHLVAEVLSEQIDVPVAELLERAEPVVPVSVPVQRSAPFARLPDRPVSTAVLIGAGHYVDAAITDFDNIANNLSGLRGRLTDPASGGFDPSRVHDFADPDWSDVPAILSATRSATDTLLVYFAGHGFTDDDGQLYLGLASTVHESAPYTALPYDRLRRMVIDSPAANKVVVLDCCFSGRAIDMLSAERGLPAELSISGTYVLTATSATVMADAAPRQRHTVFTEALLRLLGRGLDNGEELIRVGALFPSLRASLVAQGKPEPQHRGTDSIGDLALVRNPQWRTT